MSRKFKLVKKYFETGMWPKTYVRNAVVKSWITAAEYEEIVGEPYGAE